MRLGEDCTPTNGVFMEISSATATSLGEKLAGVNLSDEEGALLASLLRSDDEVEGFKMGEKDGPASFYPEVEIHLRNNVLGPLPGAWKQPGGDGYLVITMTN